MPTPTRYEISTTTFRFDFFYVVIFKTTGIFLLTMVLPLTVMVIKSAAISSLKSSNNWTRIVI